MTFEKSKIKWGYLLIFLVMMAIGICLIALRNTLVALAITIGCIVATVGIVLGIVTVAKKSRGFNFALKIILASMMLICGVVTAIFNAGAVAIIVSIFSLLLIIDASFKLNTAAMSKRYSVKLWFLPLITAVLTIVGGFFLLKYTPEEIPTASVLLGIVFIIASFSNLFSVYYVSAYENRERDEIYYEFYAAEMAPAMNRGTVEATEESTQAAAAEPQAEAAEPQQANEDAAEASENEAAPEESEAIETAEEIPSEPEASEAAPENAQNDGQSAPSNEQNADPV